MAQLSVFVFLVRVELNAFHHAVVFHDGKIVDKDLFHESLAHDGQIGKIHGNQPIFSKDEFPSK